MMTISDTDRRPEGFSEEQAEDRSSTTRPPRRGRPEGDADIDAVTEGLGVDVCEVLAVVLEEGLGVRDEVGKGGEPRT